MLGHLVFAKKRMPRSGHRHILIPVQHASNWSVVSDMRNVKIEDHPTTTHTSTQAQNTLLISYNTVSGIFILNNSLTQLK